MIAFAGIGRQLYRRKRNFKYPKTDLLGEFARGAAIIPTARLRREVAAVAGRRVAVATHGYDYDPFARGKDDPHEHLLAEPGAARGRDRGGRGVSLLDILVPAGFARDAIVTFAWRAKASLLESSAKGYSQSYEYMVSDRTVRVARSFAAVILALAESGTERITLVAHSMGTRIVAQALLLLPEAAPPPIDMVLFLGGSEYLPEAEAAAATTATFINIANRSDWVLDDFAERFGGRLFGRSAQVIGHNGLTGLANWHDIQLDRKRVVKWGEANGYDLSADGPERNEEHWGYYAHPGNHKLYIDLLSGRRTIADLVAEKGLPVGVTVPFVD
ncbi:MAG: alpha/beta fold hydrolase [Alphaproteobacteria bacterium]